MQVSLVRNHFSIHTPRSESLGCLHPVNHTPNHGVLSIHQILWVCIYEVFNPNDNPTRPLLWWSRHRKVGHELKVCNSHLGEMVCELSAWLQIAAFESHGIPMHAIFLLFLFESVNVCVWLYTCLDIFYASFFDVFSSHVSGSFTVVKFFKSISWFPPLLLQDPLHSHGNQHEPNHSILQTSFSLRFYFPQLITHLMDRNIVVT